MKIPFGIHQGNFVHISEVNSGRTDVVCPYCEQALVAKKGRLKRHHFAHDGQGCTQHFFNHFFSLAGRLPTHQPLSIYAANKVAKISAFQKKLEQEVAQLDKGNQAQLVADLRQQLTHLNRQKLAGAATILAQLDRYVSQKIAPFPEFHLLRTAQFREYTDGKRTCLFEELTLDQHEYFYPKTFHAYLPILKNYHSNNRQSLELQQKWELFQKDLAYFNRFHLYFLEVIADHQIFYKIGLTSRPLTERMREVQQDLKEHFLQVDLKQLFQQQGVAFLELFFKQKYAAHQFKIGQLTEYFKFDKPSLQRLLKDLHLLKYQGTMPPRNHQDWLDWAFLRFNGKIYGHRTKSIYVADEKYVLSPAEAAYLTRLLDF